MPIRAMNPTHPGYGMMQVGISGMMQVGFLTNKSRFVQHHCTRVELRGAKRGSFAREYFKFTHRSTGLLPAAAQRSSNQTQIARDRRSMTVHILVVPLMSLKTMRCRLTKSTSACSAFLCGAWIRGSGASAHTLGRAGCLRVPAAPRCRGIKDGRRPASRKLGWLGGNVRREQGLRAGAQRGCMPCCDASRAARAPADTAERRR